MTQVPQPGEPFEVLVSEPWTVHSSPAGGGTTMLKLANGDIVNEYWESGGEEQYALISHDRGKTWTRTAWPGDSACVGVLSDGTVLAMAYMKGVHQVAPGQFLYPRWVSRDHWKSWEGPLDTPVHIPKGTGGTGDNLKPYNGPLFWRSLMELPDGRLLATMYGYFEGDDVPIPGFRVPKIGTTPTPGFNKYRTLLVESQDKGASWSLVSTIAYDPRIGQESFCEPAMVRLPDGELVCIMRTGYTHDPMYICRSQDDGRTWSKPVSTGLTGVDPRLLLLSNGLLACAYGVKEYDGNRRERRVGRATGAWGHHPPLGRLGGAACRPGVGSGRGARAAVAGLGPAAGRSARGDASARGLGPDDLTGRYFGGANSSPRRIGSTMPSARSSIRPPSPTRSVSGARLT